MKLNFHPTRAAVLVGAALLSATFAFPAMAAGGASGPKLPTWRRAISAKSWSIPTALLR